MRKDTWLLATIIVLGIALRLIVLVFIAPAYLPIDVYIVDQQAPRTILNLQNPYDYIFSVHHYTLVTFASITFPFWCSEIFGMATFSLTS
jgi:hypothetical protein